MGDTCFEKFTRQRYVGFFSWSYFLDSDWPGKQTPTTRVYVPQRQIQKNKEGLLRTDGKSSKLKQRLNKEKNKEKTRKNNQEKTRNKTRKTKTKQNKQNKNKQTNKTNQNKQTNKQQQTQKKNKKKQVKTSDTLLG